MPTDAEIWAEIVTHLISQLQERGSYSMLHNADDYFTAFRRHHEHKLAQEKLPPVPSLPPRPLFY